MILLENLYKNKKICLIGTGESLSKHNIVFDTYDIVVGINRIYQTKYIDNINVMYNALSKKDWMNVSWMLDILKSKNQFQYLIACPWSGKRTRTIEEIIKEKNFCHDKKFIYCRNIVREVHVNKRPLTGIAALNHIMLSGAASVDIYGFDFYSQGYIDNLPKYNHDKFHDILSNKEFLYTLMHKHSSIIWNK